MTVEFVKPQRKVWSAPCLTREPCTFDDLAKLLASQGANAVVQTETLIMTSRVR